MSEAALARSRAVVAQLGHRLAAIRGRAVRNLVSKLDMGLIQLEDLDAAELAAALLAFVESDDSQTDTAGLRDAAAVLVMLLERHALGRNALHDAGTVARLERVAVADDMAREAIERVLRGLLRSSPQKARAPPAKGNGALDDIFEVTKSPKKAAAPFVFEDLEDTLGNEADADYDATAFQEDSRSEEDEVLPEFAVTAHGWACAKAYLSRGDERALIEIEDRVFTVLRALRRDSALVRESPAEIISWLRAWPMADFPSSVWLQRPKCLLALIDVCAAPASGKIADGLERLRAQAVETVLAILRAVLLVDVPLALDASMASQRSPRAATKRRYPPPRSANGQVDDEASDDEDEGDARLFGDQSRGAPISVAGACCRAFEAAARLLSNTSDPRVRVVAAELVDVVAPFVKEPPRPAADEDRTRPDADGSAASALDAARLSRCLAALEAALASSTARDSAVDGVESLRLVSERILALSLKLPFGAAPLPPKLAALRLAALGDAALLHRKPDLFKVLAGATDARCAAAAKAAFRDAALAAPLLPGGAHALYAIDQLGAAQRLVEAFVAYDVLVAERSGGNDVDGDASFGESYDAEAARSARVSGDSRAAKALEDPRLAGVGGASDARATVTALVDRIVGAWASCAAAASGDALNAALRDARLGCVLRLFASQSAFIRRRAVESVSMCTFEYAGDEAQNGVVLGGLAQANAAPLRSWLLRCGCWSLDAATRQASRTVLAKLLEATPAFEAPTWHRADDAWFEVLGLACGGERLPLARQLFSNDEASRKSAAKALRSHSEDPIGALRRRGLAPVHAVPDDACNTQQLDDFFSRVFGRASNDGAVSDLCGAILCHAQLCDLDRLAAQLLAAGAPPSGGGDARAKCINALTSRGCLRRCALAAVEAAVDCLLPYVLGAPPDDARGRSDISHDCAVALSSALFDADGPCWHSGPAAGDGFCVSAAALSTFSTLANNWTTVHPSERLASADDAVDLYYASEASAFCAKRAATTALRWCAFEADEGAFEEDDGAWDDSRLAKLCASTLTRAATRRVYGDALCDVTQWLADADARRAFSKEAWHEAFKRPLTISPQGPAERLLLGHALGALRHVVSSLDRCDHRWAQVLHALNTVIAPAALAFPPSKKPRKNDEPRSKASMHDEDLMAGCCAFIVSVCDSSISGRARKALAAANVVAPLAAQHVRAPSRSNGHTPRALRCALAVLERLLPHVADSTAIDLLRNGEPALLRRLQALCCQPRQESFLGRGVAVAALKCCRAVAQTFDLGANAWLLKRAVDGDATLDWCTRMVQHRDAEMRCRAIALVAEFATRYAWARRVALDWAASPALLAAATDLTEAPAVRGSALSFFAAVARLRRSDHDADCLGPIAAALRPLLCDEEPTITAATVCAGAAEIALALATPALAAGPALAGPTAAASAPSSDEAGEAAAHEPKTFEGAADLALRLMPRLVAWRDCFDAGVAQCADVDAQAGLFVGDAEGWALVVDQRRSKRQVAHDVATTLALRAARKLAQTDVESRDSLLRKTALLARCVETLAEASKRLVLEACASSAAAVASEAAAAIAELVYGDVTARLSQLTTTTSLLRDDSLVPREVADAASRLLAHGAAQPQAPAKTAAIVSAARLAHALSASPRWRRMRPCDSLVRLGVELARSYLDLDDAEDDLCEAPGPNEADEAPRFIVATALATVLDSNASSRECAEALNLCRKLVAKLKDLANLLDDLVDVTLRPGHFPANTHPALLAACSSDRRRRRQPVQLASSKMQSTLLCLRSLLRSDASRCAALEVDVACELSRAWRALVGAGEVASDCFEVLLGCVVNLAAGDSQAKRAIVAPPTGLAQRGSSRLSLAPCAPKRQHTSPTSTLAHRLIDLCLRSDKSFPTDETPQSHDVERSTTRANLAAAALRHISSEYVLLQGSFIGDVVIAIRRLAATAAAPFSGSHAHRAAVLSRRRAAFSRALSLLRLLVSMTMFAEAQRALLAHEQTPELLADLVHYYGASQPRKKSLASPRSVMDDDDSAPRGRARGQARAAEFTALLLRNLSLLRRNKARILAQPPLISFLLDLGASPTSTAGAVSAATSGLWALLHHSEKARMLLRSDSETAARLRAAKAHVDAKCLVVGADDDDDDGDSAEEDDCAALATAQRAIAAVTALLASPDSDEE